MTDVTDAKSERVDIRVTPNVKRTLQQAAAISANTAAPQKSSLTMIRKSRR